MPVDDRVPDALRDAAGPLPADVGDWVEVRARGDARRRQRRNAGAALSALVAVAVTVTALSLGDGDERQRVVATPPATSEVVVTTADGAVAVLSAEDGRVVRTLVDADADAPANRVTVTPDGKTVFFQSGHVCEGTMPSIYRVPATGGRIDLAGQADGAENAWPLVSPDGRWFAFVSSSDPSPGDCGPFDRLNVWGLDETGAPREPFLYLDFPPTGIVVPITWKADSSSLVVLLNEPPDAGEPYAEIRVSDDGLEQGPRFTYPKGNGWDFLPSGEPVTAFPTDATSRIATFDLQTGEEQRLLAEIDEPLYLLDADASGTSFLLEGPLGDTPDGHDLYTASSGSSRAVKIAEHVTDAAWLPGTSGPAITTTTLPAPLADDAPATVVARRGTDGSFGDYEIVELSSADGTVQRVLTEIDAGLPEYVVSANTDSVFADAFPGQACPGQQRILGSIVQTSRADGSQRRLDGFRPALSPDGTQLAYLRTECDGPSRIAVLDLATGQEQSWMLPEPYADGDVPFEDVGPFRWLPDASSLVFALEVDSDLQYWRHDVTPGEQVRLPVLGGTAAVRDLQPRGTTPTFVGMVGGGVEGPPRVIEYDLENGQIVAELLAVPWGPDANVQLVDVDASGRHLLLLRTVGSGSQTDPQHTELYRWSLGDAAPSFVARDVVAADW